MALDIIVLVVAVVCVGGLWYILELDNILSLFIGLFGGALLTLFVMLPIWGVFAVVNSVYADEIAAATVTTIETKEVSGMEREYTEASGWKIYWTDDQGKVNPVSEVVSEIVPSEDWTVEITSTEVEGNLKWIAINPETVHYVFRVPAGAMLGE